jgi:transcriptional regulator GlxA family with amidase domain
MKKIAIIVPRGEIMSSAVVAPIVIFNKLNEWLEESGKLPAFEVHVVGYKHIMPLDDGVFQVRAHAVLEESGGFDLAIVPGFTSDPAVILAENRDLLDWLRKQRHEHGAELASLCSGAFFIAAAGLADGKKVTTHWAYAPVFRSLFPAVRLQTERIVTDDGGIYASGGAYSSLNLILYLLEKFCGKEAAHWASGIFQIDPNRITQQPFALFSNQKSHGDDGVAAVQVFIEREFRQTGLTVNALAAQFGFSRRNFLRRFKAATDSAPIEYLQRVRIEAAKRLLENGTQSVEEIVGAVGYSDSKTFRMLFRKHTGFSPLAYRGKYRRRV